MTTHWDDAGWPVVRVHLSGAQTMADIEAYIAAVEGFLDRLGPGERLGMLTVSGDDLSRAEPGTAKRQMAWMGERADALRAGVAGLASVVPVHRLERDRAATAKLAAHLPFPCAVFASETECADWLRERLAVPA